MKRMLCIGPMRIGGAETFLMKLYHSIDRTKYQFDFCEPLDWKGDYDAEILDLGGRIFRTPIKTKNFHEYKKSLQDLVKRENYRYVFRASSSALAFLDLKLAKEAGAIKCIARSSSSQTGSFASDLASYVGRIRYLKYIDLMLAPSVNCGMHAFGNKYVKSDKFMILHNGLDVEQYQRDEDFRSAFRKENGWEDAFVVGHVGRFIECKNHLFLVKVFAEIKKIRNNAKLLLIGKGDMRARIVDFADSLGLKKDVLILESRKDVDRLYSVMDVLIFPSKYEGLPNVVVEAQAARLPCVISDVITKEVVNTSLVRQVSLKREPVFWAENALNFAKRLASSTNDMSTEMEAFGRMYDIKQVARQFQEEVFEK